MKKLLTILIVSLSLTATAQTKTAAPDTTKPKEQQLSLTGGVSTFEALIYALSQSQAPHNTVEALKAWMLGQLTKQVNPAQTSAPKK